MSINIALLPDGQRQRLETLRRMPLVLAELVESARKKAICFGSDASLNTIGQKNIEYDKFVNICVEQIKSYEFSVQEYLIGLEKWMLAFVKSKQADPISELLYEFRTDKAWRRIEKILDSVKQSDLLQTIKDLVSEFTKTDDRVALEALQAELGFYFQARHLNLPPDLAGCIRDACAAYSPEQIVKTLRQEIAIGLSRLNEAFSTAKRAIQLRDTVEVLPGWQADEYITLNLAKELADWDWYKLT